MFSANCGLFFIKSKSAGIFSIKNLLAFIFIGKGGNTNTNIQVVKNFNSLNEGDTAEISVSNDNQRIIAYNYPQSLNEGQSKTFQVKLNVKPSSNVSVSFTSSDNSALTISPSSISFTPDNYNSFQNITLSAIEDKDSTSESTNISVSASGLPGVTFPVTTYDNDIQTLFSLVSPININEGTSQTVQIQLSGDPSTSRTVQIASSDTNSVTVSPATVTFANG